MCNGNFVAVVIKRKQNRRKNQKKNLSAKIIIIICRVNVLVAVMKSVLT